MSAGTRPPGRTIGRHGLDGEMANAGTLDEAGTHQFVLKPAQFL
jgi:hypothetical protein